ALGVSILFANLFASRFPLGYDETKKFFRLWNGRRRGMKMFSTASRHRTRRAVRSHLALLAIGLLAVGASFAQAQTMQQPAVVGLQAGGLGRPYPSPLYFQVFPALNDGDYKNAADGFRREAAGGLKIGATRWIDSVCGYAMSGECQYRLGN